jgi:hypothetical protein
VIDAVDLLGEPAGWLVAVWAALALAGGSFAAWIARDLLR